MKDLVSVCVPTYNGGRYLAESLKCIIDQEYQNLEILVVDDQSTDGTLSIVKEFQNTDSRIKLIRNSQNLGLVGNWNKCIAEASGEWIKFHFQDDLMLPETINSMLGVAHQFDVKFVLSDREYLFEGKQKRQFDKITRLSNHYKETTILEVEDLASFLNNFGVEDNFLGEPILGLVHKNLFRTYGNYDQQFKQIVDLEFWLKLSLNEKFVFIPDRLHTFRVHSDSQGAKNKRKRGLNPTHLDRIKLTKKIQCNDVYSNYRDIKGFDYIDKLVSFYVNKYILIYGYNHMKQVLDKEVMSHFKNSMKNKLLARFADFKSWIKFQGDFG